VQIISFDSRKWGSNAITPTVNIRVVGSGGSTLASRTVRATLRPALRHWVHITSISGHSSEDTAEPLPIRDTVKA
jgi:hypothetical protein